MAAKRICPVAKCCRPAMTQRAYLRFRGLCSLRRAAAVVCVLLVLLVGAAQMLHAHGSSLAPDPGCSLCAVAHLSALPTPVLAAPVSVETVIALRTPERASVPRRLLVNRLSIRPPPVANVFA